MDELIFWNEVDDFLALLGRTGEIHLRLYPRKKKERKEISSGTALSFRLLKKEGRSITEGSAGIIREIEATLRKPEYQEHSLGVVINPGGTENKQIAEGRALFFEADGGLSIEEQEAIPSLFGLPAPTMSVWTAGKSLHHYWVAGEGQGLPPDKWRKAQERLIAAVSAISPEAGVDPAIKDPSRVMRVPGGIHPSTGERSRLHSSTGNLFNLAALVDILPTMSPPTKTRATMVAPKEEGSKGEEITKAREALAFLHPLDFASYTRWIDVGMVLHSVSEMLLDDWIQWGRTVWEESFDEEEHHEKWRTFDREKAEGLTIGTLIHLAKDYGYQPKAARSCAKASTAPSSPPPLTWSELISLALEAMSNGDVDAEMELRAEIAGRFRRNDAQVDAALFRLLTEQEAGPKKIEVADSVDLRTVQGLDYLVDGHLPANGLTMSYGAKGAGKTTAAVAVSFCIIDGKGFLDHTKPAKQGKVLFIASDSGAGPLRSVLQDMGYGDHEALTPGEDQRFFVWAHEADQGHSAWDVSVRGCVKLLQFVKAKKIDLVVIDSAKAVCAKAGIAYTDNDAVNALLTFVKEVITPHTSVLFLSHDGTAVGSHAGAKAWAEIVDVVHRQTRPDGNHNSRTWTVVKNRLGPTREFSYSLEEGELVLADGVETIGDASSAVVKVLREAHGRGLETLSRKGIHEEVIKRFDFAPKTIDNTLQRLVQGKAPKVVRKGKGFYALSPKELYRGCLVGGEERTLLSVPDSDLPITRALPEGNAGQSSDSPLVPEPAPVGSSRVIATPFGTTEEMPNSSPRGTHPPIEITPVEIFESVEVLQDGLWGNGWVVSEEGQMVEVFRADDSGTVLRLPCHLVRPCRS
jgi:archaellum biogenesis ATPase FlaH